MPVITWDQVRTWRLSRQFVLERAPRARMLDVVRRLGGVHAQVMSAAEMQLAARVDSLTPADVRNALWRDRTLVKTWMLRGTLHLLAADELPLYMSALQAAFERFYRRNSWLKYNGVTLAELEAIIEGVRATLGAEPMTREQLASAIAARTNTPKLAEQMRSGWGMLLKPTAHACALCFGPSRGQNVTFVGPAHWLGEQPPVDPDVGQREIALRFLDAYGPATAGDFGHWLGMDDAKAKKLFRSLGDDIAEVEMEDRRAWTPAASLDALAATEPRDSVRLLPGFDPYVLSASPPSEQIVDPSSRSRVYRPQGWISAVVLVKGRVAGVWSVSKARGGAKLDVDLFAPVSAAITRGIEAEIDRLTAFLASAAPADET